MCGIVGILANPKKERVSMFEDMLHMDVVRGLDSTGVAFINNKAVDVVKDTVLPAELMESPDYKRAMKRQRFCYIGHNRAATKGWVTKENAHPFTVDHITLVHNGTLHTTYKLPDDHKFETDSEAICNAIAKFGIEPVWPVLDGAATIVYWDANTRTLNIASNGKRPFYFHPLKNSEGVVFSSEKWTLLAAAMRNGVELHEPSANYCPKSDTLYTITLNHKKNAITYKETALQPYSFTAKIPGVPAPWEGGSKSSSSFSFPGERNYHSPGEEAHRRWIGDWPDDAIPFDGGHSRMADDHTGDSSSNVTPLNEEAERQLRIKYPEMFDKDGDELDTRGIPFRNAKGATEKRDESSFEAIDLATENRKTFTLGWFLANYLSCINCEEELTGEDYPTARCLDEHSAICAGCQKEIFETSGLRPSQIRHH